MSDRQWFPTAASLLAALALSSAACGGGGDDITPPPPPAKPVATVVVSPGTATVNVAATVQFAATLRDAGGTLLSGRRIAWASQSQAVATVNTSGLVTGVAPGTTTITATSEGKTGSAQVTVTPQTQGQVIAQALIGPAGGTVATDDIGVAIAPGAFTGIQTVRLIRDPARGSDYPDNAGSLVYQVDGIPAGQTVQVRMRIRLTQPLWGQGAINIATPTVAFEDETGTIMGTRLFPATDSSGWLVATVPLTGRASSAASGAPGTASGFDPMDFRAAAEVSGLVGIFHATSSAGHFEGWGFGAGKVLAEATRKVNKTLPLLEQAYSTVEALGYSFAHRTAWPIDVYIFPYKNARGAYYSVLPPPLDPNLSYISYSPALVDDPYYPGTVIHEFFHFTQAYFTSGFGETALVEALWLNEATATYMAERHPASPAPYLNPTAWSWRDSLFSGLDRELPANSGYGKAPIIRYMVDRWGIGTLRQVYDRIRTGETPVAALTTTMPEPVDAWWPALLTQNLATGIYAWDIGERQPKDYPLVYSRSLRLGEGSCNIPESHPLFAKFEYFSRDTTWFGGTYRLPVYFTDPVKDRAILLAFRKSPGAAAYQVVDKGDTVFVPAELLNSRDTALVVVTQTGAQSPYRGHLEVECRVDLRLPEADWHVRAVTSEDNRMSFACDHPGDTVEFDAADNAVSLASLLASGGTWTRKAGVTPDRYEWVPTPAFADTLTKYRMSAQSSVQVGGLLRDSVIVEGRLTIDWLSARNPSSPIHFPPLPEWLLLLVPAGLLVALLRRRVRWAVPATVGITVAVFGACELGQIAFAIDESFEFRYGEFRFVADPGTPNTALMTLADGKGRTTLNSYRSEYWTYVTDGAGAKVDSTRSSCTGTGSATYVVAGEAWADGFEPPDPAAVPGPGSLFRGRIRVDTIALRKFLPR